MKRTPLALGLATLALLCSPTAALAARPDTACGAGRGDPLVADKGHWFDFTRACTRHDDCYGHKDGRKYCDKRFLADMRRSCRGRKHRKTCRLIAYSYYRSVRTWGWAFY